MTLYEKIRSCKSGLARAKTAKVEEVRKYSVPYWERALTAHKVTAASIAEKSEEEIAALKAKEKELAAEVEAATPAYNEYLNSLRVSG